MVAACSSGWPAPAKLNLFLHIIGRRADGYHLLQSVFQFLDFGDSLSFTPRDDGRIQLLNPLPGVAPEDDLIFRAAKRLQQETGGEQGADIAVDKRLPMGGGLGGGSSDAATTLVALNRIWGCGLEPQQLAELGIALGADLPVFIRGQAAWAEGVGEQLEPVTLPEPWYLVVVPPVTVSTAEIFSAPELTRDCPRITIRAFLSGEGRNVCEPLVRARYPSVDRAIHWLADFAEPRMTGTGACVFAPFEGEQAGREALAELPAEFSGFVARAANRSSLMDRLAAE